MNPQESMQVTDSMLANLAKLARLRFTGDEQEAMKHDLQNMIAFADKLNEINTENVEPLLHLTPVVNITREDLVHGELTKEEALSNVPMHNNSFVKVPQTIRKPD